jgi:hypothetical protein
MILVLAKTAALSLLALAVTISQAMALRCSTSQSRCFDTKTKEWRTCTTKVCLDDKGTIVSTETLVELKGKTGNKPKVVVPKAATSGAAKQ